MTFDEAVAALCAVAQPIGAETVPFAEAAGRRLAEALSARTDSPSRDLSSMDGYAVRESDLVVLPASLPVAGEFFAGHAGGLAPLEPGTCVRIFTGAPLPHGADRVVVQENVRRDGAFAHFERPHGEARFIRKAGSDFRAGDMLLEAGTRLHWRALTTAAAADRAELRVFRQPRVALIATGDELAAPGTAFKRNGAIPDSVSLGIAAFVQGQGGVVVRTAHLGDDPDLLAAEARQALGAADLVVMLGGASVGDRDHARSAFGHAPDYMFAKVAIKPGKPAWLARAGDRLVLGLPGNPTSALVTARLFLGPLLVGLGGGDPAGLLRFAPAACEDAVPPAGDRETFLRGRRTTGGVSILPGEDSGNQRLLARADCLIRLRPNAAGQPPGSPVQVLPFD